MYLIYLMCVCMHTHVHVCAYACSHRNTHLLMNVHMYVHTQMYIYAHTHTSWCTYEDQKTTLGKSVLSYCVDPGNQILVTRLGGKPLDLWDQLADPPWYYWFITIVVLGLGKWLCQWSAGKELSSACIWTPGAGEVGNRWISEDHWPAIPV